MRTGVIDERKPQFNHFSADGRRSKWIFLESEVRRVQGGRKV